MRFQHNIGPLLLIACFFIGCSLEKEEAPVVVAEIAKEFNLEMRETLDSTGREFLLRAATVKAYDCSNYSIQYIWRFQETSMLLSLLRIAAPFICDFNPQQIYAETSAGVLQPGTYSFSIDLRGAIINKGTLSVLADRYRLRMETEHGIVLEHKELLKVPPGAIWGYIAYDPAFRDQALELIQEIFSHSQPLNPSKGYYGYYKIEDTGLSIEGQPEDGFAYPFLRQSPLNAPAIASIIQQYRSRYPTGLRIIVKDGKGRTF
jgi:hypothetical protein